MHEQDPFLLKREHAAELFLIRHGDAIPEADEIIPSGIYNNLPLSKKGREQARVLAERLKYLHFDAAYSSPLRRCQETAAPLLEALGLQATIVEDIREVQTRSGTQIPEVQDGDDLSILTRALHARQAEMTRIAALTGHWNDVIMGETSAGFRRRVVEAIDGIAKRHRGARVLVFAHGGVINAYAAEALGLERDFFFPCANISITIVRVSGEKRVLYVLNDVAHLKMY